MFTQIRWNSLATCLGIFNDNIQCSGFVLSVSLFAVYIGIRVWYAKHDKAFRNRVKLVYICLSTFDRTELFQTLCLFTFFLFNFRMWIFDTSFSWNRCQRASHIKFRVTEKLIEANYLIPRAFPPAHSPAEKSWERSWGALFFFASAQN